MVSAHVDPAGDVPTEVHGYRPIQPPSSPRTDWGVANLGPPERRATDLRNPPSVRIRLWPRAISATSRASHQGHDGVLDLPYPRSQDKGW
jgi:hypothetical protein